MGSIGSFDNFKGTKTTGIIVRTGMRGPGNELPSSPSALHPDLFRVLSDLACKVAARTLEETLNQGESNET
jgi:hypothetical protein